MQKLIALYDDYFPNQFGKISKCKQRLYFGFLKNKNNKNGVEYKKLLGSIKNRAKANIFTRIALHYKNNVKKFQGCN